ncbi:MnhB domain-containing protein [Oceanirhabdus seepicola]|uniref:MnhB domain-containing protein n=2 Tax=Oceanirhabdus seepicola TaxID=2828781 RepID=A0A9J6P426_9CLOT|nr:MnhB domain-containing protein [Oceanirhabdus seepicola]
MLLFGFYIILYGDSSPGGGFQGGAIIATTFILTYFIQSKKNFNVNVLLKLEKLYFVTILIIASISFFTKGELFTNFVTLNSSVQIKRIFLLLLNFFIGLKVASGLITIFSTFIEEGK